MVDGDGSNGSRVRLWKVELQKLAEELGFPSKFAIYHRRLANGTRSSTGCFPLLA